MKDADGTEYLHFSERQTKTRSGADPRNVRPIKPKAFAVQIYRANETLLLFSRSTLKRDQNP